MRDQSSGDVRPVRGHLIDLWDYRARRKALRAGPDEKKGEVLLFTGVFYQRPGPRCMTPRPSNPFGPNRRRKV